MVCKNCICLQELHLTNLMSSALVLSSDILALSPRWFIYFISILMFCPIRFGLLHSAPRTVIFFRSLPTLRRSLLTLVLWVLLAQPLLHLLIIQQVIPLCLLLEILLYHLPPLIPSSNLTSPRLETPYSLLSPKCRPSYMT